MSWRTHHRVDDGFYARFPTCSAAVQASLQFQFELSQADLKGHVVKVRIGIHSGEVFQDHAVTSQLLGMAPNITARIMSLALPGQILMTAPVYHDAIQYIRTHPAVAKNTVLPALRWINHGQYLLKGDAFPFPIFEVGATGIAPLCTPPSSEKARRLDEKGTHQNDANKNEIPGKTSLHAVTVVGLSAACLAVIASTYFIRFAKDRVDLADSTQVSMPSGDTEVSRSLEMTPSTPAREPRQPESTPAVSRFNETETEPKKNASPLIQQLEVAKSDASKRKPDQPTSRPLPESLDKDTTSSRQQIVSRVVPNPSTDQKSVSDNSETLKSANSVEDDEPPTNQMDPSSQSTPVYTDKSISTPQSSSLNSAALISEKSESRQKVQRTAELPPLDSIDKVIWERLGIRVKDARNGVNGFWLEVIKINPGTSHPQLRMGTKISRFGFSPEDPQLRRAFKSSMRELQPTKASLVQKFLNGEPDQANSEGRYLLIDDNVEVWLDME